MPLLTSLSLAPLLFHLTGPALPWLVSLSLSIALLLPLICFPSHSLSSLWDTPSANINQNLPHLCPPRLPQPVFFWISMSSLCVCLFTWDSLDIQHLFRMQVPGKQDQWLIWLSTEHFVPCLSLKHTRCTPWRNSRSHTKQFFGKTLFSLRCWEWVTVLADFSLNLTTSLFKEHSLRLHPPAALSTRPFPPKYHHPSDVIPVIIHNHRNLGKCAHVHILRNDVHIFYTCAHI